MASLEEMDKAKGRGIDWLLAQRNPDGSFGPRQEGMFYYRLPWTLAVAGRNREASMLCQWIRTNMFTEKGDFDGKFGRDLYKENYYTYPNANIIYGAHILRQFDLSVRGMQFLLTLQDKKSGGFFDGMTDKGPGGGAEHLGHRPGGYHLSGNRRSGSRQGRRFLPGDDV